LWTDEYLSLPNARRLSVFVFGEIARAVFQTENTKELNDFDHHAAAPELTESYRLIPRSTVHLMSTLAG
jgi:hypothetical protein